MGNTLTAHDGRHADTYNQAGRLSDFRKDGVLRGRYTCNALGQRTIVTRYDSGGTRTATVLCFCDRDGQLESELRDSPAGQLQHSSDYVYLDDNRWRGRGRITMPRGPSGRKRSIIYTRIT
jgi:hypothetical protein